MCVEGGDIVALWRHIPGNKKQSLTIEFLRDLTEGFTDPDPCKFIYVERFLSLLKIECRLG